MDNKSHDDDDDYDLGDFIDVELVPGVNYFPDPDPGFRVSFWETHGATPETLERLMEMLRHAG